MSKHTKKMTSTELEAQLQMEQMTCSGFRKIAADLGAELAESQRQIKGLLELLIRAKSVIPNNCCELKYDLDKALGGGGWDE
jgi:hypothetical protein